MMGDPTRDSLTVRTVDPGSDARWEEFVRRHPEGLIYHHPAWLEVLEREYGTKAIALACEDAEGRLQGILPLLRTRGVPLGLGGTVAGRRLSSLPRTPICGPLATGPESVAALVEAAAASVRGDPRTSLEMKPPWPAEPVAGVQIVPWSSSYVLELPESPDQIRFGDARTHGSIKRAVSKAARAGVMVRRGESEVDLRAWYKLYLEAMRAHLVVPRPYSFFLTAWRVLQPRGLMRLLLAHKDDEGGGGPLAGSIYLLFGHTAIFAFNGRRAQDLGLRPNDAIHWHAIHEACEAGFRRYDLGEVDDDQPGLIRFKRKWGAEPRPLHRYYMPGFPESRPSGSSPGGALPDALRRGRAALWPHVPLPATSAIGRLAYRFL